MLSVSAAALYLLLPDLVRNKIVDYLISFAIGMLLGTSFLHLLPEAMEGQGHNTHSIMATLLLAILVFFIMEKTLIWRHHHFPATNFGKETTTNKVNDASAPIILLGDSFHNFIDGILIATAFMTDFSLGVVTAVTVIGHEIPQELGDFAILIRAGLTRRRAFLLNMLSSFAMFLGAGVALLSVSFIEAFNPYLLVLAASSFIYVAMSDLIPALNRRVNAKELVLQILLIAIGMLAVSWHQPH